MSGSVIRLVRVVRGANSGQLRVGLCLWSHLCRMAWGRSSPQDYGCSPTPEAALSGVQDSSHGSVDSFEINLKATGFSILWSRQGCLVVLKDTPVDNSGVCSANTLLNICRDSAEKISTFFFFFCQSVNEGIFFQHITAHKITVRVYDQKVQGCFKVDSLFRLCPSDHTVKVNKKIHIITLRA